VSPWVECLLKLGAVGAGTVCFFIALTVALELGWSVSFETAGDRLKGLLVVAGLAYAGISAALCAAVM